MDTQPPDGQILQRLFISRLSGIGDMRPGNILRVKGTAVVLNANYKPLPFNLPANPDFPQVFSAISVLNDVGACLITSKFDVEDRLFI